MAIITINGITLDPAAKPMGLAAVDLESPDASKSDYILIQTKKPIDQQQKEDLAKRQVSILEYVPDDTYLCHFKPKDLKEIRALPYVAWASVYSQGFKVSPALSGVSLETTEPSLHAMMLAPKEQLSRAPKVVDVILHKNVNAGEVRKKIADAARLDPEELQLSRNKVRLTVPARRLEQLAALDEVRQIEEVIPTKLHNNIARGILKIGTNNPGPASLEGAGQIVGVADTGFDKGSTTNVHPAFAGRVVKLYPLGRAKANDPDGHGTHVAGSVLGDGTSASLGIAIRGAAPKAKLVLQSLLDANGGLGGLPNDLHDLFETPYQKDGVRIHTNSWGSTVGDGRYDANAQELDDFVWNNRDFIVCFAAGNEGRDGNANGKIDPKSVTPPGTARNCITVGATENDRSNEPMTYGQGWPNDFPAAPIAPDKVADKPDGMVAFSSRGPTKDKRVKPDVVAPGSYILSTRSRDTQSHGWKLSVDPLYFFEGGTSMATPLVAGCVALVREHLIKERKIAKPSAALVKAMLINGARDIPGQYNPSEAPGIPNDAEGFGRVDIAATVGPYAAKEKVDLQDEQDALDTGNEKGTKIAIPQGATSLKVTVVWTDAPGETLQNDLDLIVRAGGRERHGNMSTTSTQFDRVNNVEQVIWNNVPAGSAEIIVHAHRIAQSPQSYALVIRTA
jgi:hypothetical protein